MKKKFEVVWSIESFNRKNEIVDYLQSEWTEREVGSFLKRLKNFEKIAERLPNAFPESDSKTGYRKAVISKQTSIIYRLDSKMVRVYTVFDNRQDPAKLSK